MDPAPIVRGVNLLGLDRYAVESDREEVWEVKMPTHMHDIGTFEGNLGPIIMLDKPAELRNNLGRLARRDVPRRNPVGLAQPPPNNP